MPTPRPTLAHDTLPQTVESLICEAWNGQPICYAGFEAVLRGKAQADDIIGAGCLQMLIWSALYHHLFSTLDRSQHKVFMDEMGGITWQRAALGARYFRI